MNSATSNIWNSDSTSLTGVDIWPAEITSGTAVISDQGFGLTIGISEDGQRVDPWDQRGLDYKIGADRYSYAEDEKVNGKRVIKVDKGSPAKARYAVFYAVNKDPVIFCKTKREMIKAVKKLLKRKEVDYKSIRIFKLVGGAKVIKKSKKIKKK